MGSAVGMAKGGRGGGSGRVKARATGAGAVLALPPAASVSTSRITSSALPSAVR